MPAASEGLPAVVRRQPPVNGCHRGRAGSGLRDRGTENCRGPGFRFSLDWQWVAVVRRGVSFGGRG